VVSTLVLFLLGGPFPLDQALAQWSTDATVNTPICLTATQQQGFGMVSDGHGGAILIWLEFDAGSGDYDIRAQRIGSDGLVLWAASGVAICEDSGYQSVPSVASDGSGGAFAVWQDNRTGEPDIYAQRIDSNGVVQWAPDGVPVCDTSGSQTFPQVRGDGSGGAIVIWQDLRGGVHYVPFAQKLDGSGLAQWTRQGVLLSLSGIAETPQLINDGSGGAIVTWHQYVSPPGQFDIYVQRILANGTIAWGPEGVALCVLTSNQLRPRLVTDGHLGALVVWEDSRNGPNPNLYAQAVDSNGVVQWTVNGLDVAPLSTLGQRDHRLLSDGAGGVFITWQYDNFGIYAQRLNSNGVPQWAADGVSLDGAWDSRTPELAPDGSAGAIVTWYRVLGNSDIYAQRINPAGAVLWTTNGVAVSLATSGQIFPRLIPDGGGGTILAWLDSRNDPTTSTDIYAQWVSSTGTLGVPTGVANEPQVLPGAFKLEQNVPNPFNPSTTIRYHLPTRGHVTLEVFNVLGRHVATLVDEAQGPGSQAVNFDARGMASGVYYYRLQTRALEGGAAGDLALTRKLVLIR
jgi:hypothetical protein